MKMTRIALALVSTLFVSGCVSTATDLKKEKHLVSVVVVPLSIDEIAVNLQQYDLRCPSGIGIERDLADDKRGYTRLWYSGETLLYIEYQEMPSGAETTVTSWARHWAWKRRAEKYVETMSNPEECAF